MRLLAALTLLSTVAVLPGLSSCAVEGGVQSQIKVRNLTVAEALEDFEMLVTKVKALYGPLEFKERRFGYTFTTLVEQTRAEIARSSTDVAFFAAYKKFLAHFQDGHVGITYPSATSALVRFQVPIFVTPVEHRAIVSIVGKEVEGQGVELGDEILSVDGMTPAQAVEIGRKYTSFGNEVSDEHLMYLVLNRPSFITDMSPKKDTATVVVQKKDGTTRTLQFVWRAERDVASSTRFVTSSFVDGYYATVANELNSVSLNVRQMGAEAPYFVTNEVVNRFGFTRVSPNAQFLERFGLKPEDAVELHSYLYRFEGKTILMVRIPHYMPKDSAKSVKTYQALLSQYEPFVDALVIDQNHNPGGKITYALDLYSLFAKKEGASFVQRMHADRDWIASFKEYAKGIDPTLTNEQALALLHNAKIVEDSYDAGQTLTAPIPLIGGNTILPNAKYSWKKPVLVLADELSGSCGDIFPMLMQRNGTAKVFGKRTMGLGGNVEEVVQLGHSQAIVRLTRGLFTSYKADGNYADADFIENNGVTPDFAYDHTVADTRAGFVAFVEAFSKKAIETAQ